MSQIADLILRGRTKAARELAEANPELLLEQSTGPERLFPADIALRCGHVDLVAQFCRLRAPMKLAVPSYRELLHEYPRHLSCAYFCASLLDGMARSIWEQLFAGRQVYFEGQDPAFG